MKALFTIFSFLLMVSVYAQTIVFVKQDAVGANDGTSWANAFTNLQSALDTAAAGSHVWIAAGNYIPQGATPQESHFWVLVPLKLYGGFAGIESSLSERNWQLNKTIINGDKNSDDVAGNFNTKRTDNAHHTMIIDAPDGESIIDGIIFQGGSTRIDTYAADATDEIINRWSGGALYVRKSPVTMANNVFHDNLSGRGSGFFAAGDLITKVKLVISNSEFHNNNATYHGAGAFISQWDSALILNCHFHDNTSSQNAGGLNLSNTNGTVADCLFNNNMGNYGGAMLVFHNSQSSLEHAIVELKRNTFIENTALSTGGGFNFWNFEKGFSLTVDSCVFEKNKCTNIYGGPGAINVEDRADIYSSEQQNTFILSNSIIRDCEAAFTGGVYLTFSDDSFDIKMNHVDLINNKGYRSAGALNITISDLALGEIELKNILFDSNTADLFRAGAFEYDIFENKYAPSMIMDSCIFSNNVSAGYGGAYTTFPYNVNKKPNTTIRNSQFNNNTSVGSGSSLSFIQENVIIENTTFKDNYSFSLNDPTFSDGGTIYMADSKLLLTNSIFQHNTSEDEAGGIYLEGGSDAEIENVLFRDNLGNNSIYSRDTVSLRNVTMIGNIVALGLDTNSHTTIQNSIFESVAENLKVYGPSLVFSKGSNISSDNSMSDYINGYGSYDDMHETDPKLNVDFVPEKGSPAIDASNPEGVTSLLDLAGNPRMLGGGIDIGSFESFLTSAKDAIWNDPAISVFPNPVSEVLNVKLENSWLGETSILVYNQLGQQVYTAVKNKDGNTEVFEENVINLAQGQYILLVKAGRQTYASTIIIQR